MSERPELVEALAWMLDLSHELHPDDLGALTEQAVEIIGGWDAQLYFADLAQDVLLCFSGDGEPELDIDATMAGRAYRTGHAVGLDAGEARRLWVPIVDGADRIGVLGVLVEEDDPDTIGAVQRIVTVIAEIMVARSQYGDSLAGGRRRRPLSLASELRWAMLPPRTFVTKQVTISAVVAPAYEVAGDAFDYSVTGNTAHLAVFDAMGHGLEASRIASLAVGAYRFARRTQLDLVATHELIDAAIASEFGDDRYATAAFVQLDLDVGRLRLLLAGHPRPLLLRDHRLIGELEVRATLPLGIGDPNPAVVEVQLEPDDRVLMFSDGVTEARDADGEEFGVDRLADFFVRAQASDELAPETLRRLGRAIVAHQDVPLADDATLLSLQWRRPPT